MTPRQNGSSNEYSLHPWHIVAYQNQDRRVWQFDVFRTGRTVLPPMPLDANRTEVVSFQQIPPLRLLAFRFAGSQNARQRLGNVIKVRWRSLNPNQRGVALPVVVIHIHQCD